MAKSALQTSVLRSNKLVAIAFQQPANVVPVLRQLEEVLLCCLLSQLSLLGDLSFRDLSARVTLSHKLSFDETYQQYKQICQSNQARYLLTGSLTVSLNSLQALEQVQVTLRLYDAVERRYAVDFTQALAIVESSLEEQAGLPNEVLPEVPEIASFNRLLTQGLAELAKALRPEEARTIQGAISKGPFTTAYPAVLYLVEAQKQAKNAEKVPLYEAALRLDPQLEPAHLALARIYRTEEIYDKSVFYYRKALEYSKGTPRIKAVYATDAGIGCALLGKQELALKWWQYAIDCHPTYINPYFNIANTYEDQDDLPQAEVYFAKAQSLAPDDFRTFFNLARLYSKMGLWEKALAQYERQLLTEGQDPWCHSDIASCYLHLGKVEQARTHLEKTVLLDPQGEAGQFAQLILQGLSA